MKKNNTNGLKSQINLKSIKKLMIIFFIDLSSSTCIKKIFLAFLNIEKYFKWIKNNQKWNNSQKVLNGITKIIKNHFMKLEFKRNFLQLVPYFCHSK